MNKQIVMDSSSRDSKTIDSDFDDDSDDLDDSDDDSELTDDF